MEAHYSLNQKARLPANSWSVHTQPSTLFADALYGQNRYQFYGHVHVLYEVIQQSHRKIERQHTFGIEKDIIDHTV